MFRKSDAIEVSVKIDGQNVSIRDDGFIGTPKPQKAKIRVLVKEGISIHLLTVDAEKNIHLRKGINSKEGKAFDKDIALGVSKDGSVYAKYPNNNIRMLTISNGKVRVWEFALVGQRGKFFLTSQLVYEAQCFSDNGVFSCPRFHDWPQMVSILAGMIDVADLPPKAEYLTPSTIDVTPPKPCTGRVRWYNYASGLGMIETHTGEQARVHWKQVNRGNGHSFAFLIEGERVEYFKLRAVNPSIADETSFKKEAIGVRPV